MRNVYALSLLLAAALAGCAPVERRPFDDAAGETTAQITFRNGTPGRARVALFDDGERCTGRRFLPDLLIIEERTVRVRTGRSVPFQFQYDVPNVTIPRTCQVLASFAPTPGAHYVATLRHTSAACTVEVAQAETDANGKIRSGLTVAAVRRQAAKNPGGETGHFCLPLE